MPTAKRTSEPFVRGLQPEDIARLPEPGWRRLLEAHRAQVLARLDQADLSRLCFEVSYDSRGRLAVRAALDGPGPSPSTSMMQLLRTLHDRLLLASERTCAMCGNEDQARLTPIAVDMDEPDGLRRRTLCAGHAYLALSDQVMRVYGLPRRPVRN